MSNEEKQEQEVDPVTQARLERLRKKSEAEAEAKKNKKPPTRRRKFFDPL